MANATLTLHCDARTGEYTLTVEYQSNLPPAEHEDEHKRIFERARALLLAKGYDPDKVQVKLVRVSPTTIPVSPIGEVSVLVPEPQEIIHVSTRD